jgi:hypothetical protein
MSLVQVWQFEVLQQAAKGSLNARADPRLLYSN